MAIAPVSPVSSPKTVNPLDKLAGDKTMFLKMLTTQMQNQDPLNPMDATQYTQQLVQFSQVEQSIQQSATLNNILGALSSDKLLGAADTIGKTAYFDSAIAGLSADAPAQWHYDAARPVASITATIADEGGNTVATRTLDGQSGAISWDGTLDSGGRAKDGSYSITIAATDANGASVPVTIGSYGKVQQLWQDASGLRFDVNGATYAASALSRLGQQ